MSGQFHPTGDGGAAITLDEVEISILRSLTVQLLEMIGPGPEDDPEADPLAALFAEGPSEPPSDPAMARLFPDAYGPGPQVCQEVAEKEAEQARQRSAEFRRFTENDLRAKKREDGMAVVRRLDALPPAGAVLTLRPEESQQWLCALNDLRLAIGTRLGVSDEEDGEALYALPDGDPRKPMVMAYLWLGQMQETLVETLGY